MRLDWYEVNTCIVWTVANNEYNSAGISGQNSGQVIFLENKGNFP